MYSTAIPCPLRRNVAPKKQAFSAAKGNQLDKNKCLIVLAITKLRVNLIKNLIYQYCALIKTSHLPVFSVI